ncbi:MAG: hypothetical protein GY847_34660 [Proteobacteria bacterium]|nr:hypothetical protein [Pseudomonadota bacterium]
MTTTRFLLFFYFALACLTLGCGDDDASGDDGIDSGAEAGADGDGDGDSDGDGDGDSDGDGDGDSDSDADTETDDPSSCQDHEAYNPSAKKCVDCSDKDCVLEGEVATYEITTVTGQCICQTEPGYFYSMSELKAVLCDADKDGWITMIAKTFIEGDDQALKDNARCDLRRVDSFVFHPETLDETPVKIDPPLGLYEPNNRDAASELEEDEKAPPYGLRRLLAQELNSLTKACVSSIADYNGNKAADVAEWEKNEDIDPAFARYAKYSYFLELYRGYYEPPASGQLGSYHIAEKSRLTSAEDWNLVPASLYGRGGTKDYWRECLRRPDSSYNPKKPAIGYGFSWVDYGHKDPMRHHSQFKCLQVLSSSETPDPVKAPHLLNGDHLDEYVLNTCESMGSSLPNGFVDGTSATYNPHHSEVTCIENEATETGDVGLAVVLYQHYTEKGDHQRGCINECVYYLEWPDLKDCTGYPDSAGCDTVKKEFGMGSCGCIGNYAYPECLTCKDNWDITTGCETCIGNWDIEQQCDECFEGWNMATNCGSCAENRDIWTGCTTCTGNFDEAEDCLECSDDDLNGHWQGSACEECKDNWDIETGCVTCKNHWTDEFDTDLEDNDDCGTCPNDDVLGHWNDSPDAGCNICVNTSEWDADTDTTGVDVRTGHWDIETGCTTCLDLWSEESQSCKQCIVGEYEEDTDNDECKRTINLLKEPGAEGCIGDDDGISSCSSWGSQTSCPCDDCLSADNKMMRLHGKTDAKSGENYFSFHHKWDYCTVTKNNCYCQKVELNQQYIKDIESGKLTRVLLDAWVYNTQDDAGGKLTMKFHDEDSESLDTISSDEVTITAPDWHFVELEADIPPGLNLIRVCMYVSKINSSMETNVGFDDLDLYLSVD